eukprot:TRINITY_DN16967_c0_g1_i1.p1 TRINITY_DN16967_c0_g1~~TRINITY_DN16967_c0_g1_i1.p1  ORF type:complete len:65 (+),score=15.14 TRINITY_DN16967_c0_g1_i1:180-374(+)
MIQSVDMDGDYELDFMEFTTLMKRRPDFEQFIMANFDKNQSRRVVDENRMAPSPLSTADDDDDR